MTYSGLDGETHSNPTTYTIEMPTIILSAPTNKTGYEFDGWFTAAEGGMEVTQIISGSIGNKTLHARWTAKEYTISYNVDGGSAVSDLIVTYGATLSI